MSVRPPMASFARGLSILAAIADAGSLRVDIVALRAGLPLSTTYRYVRTLVAEGFLDERDRIYSPGPRLLALARLGHEQDRVQQAAEPVLDQLGQRTRESVLLVVRVGIQALVIDRVESPLAVRLSFQRGTTHPLYAGASAKALLADAPEGVVQAVIDAGLVRLTPQTPSVAELRAQLAEVRVRGWAVTCGEADEHAAAVGVPIVRDGRAICAISVAGPLPRFGVERARRLVPELQDSARRVLANLDAQEVLSA